MRLGLMAIALFAAVAVAPLRAAPSGNELITAISLSDLADLLASDGLVSRLETIEGAPVVIADLQSVGVQGFIHIAGLACGSEIRATNATTPCQVLEFAAVIEIPASVTDAEISDIDRRAELSSIERLDATHVIVTDGVVLTGGITASNLGANIGFFAGQCLGAVRELNKGRGRTS